MECALYDVLLLLLLSHPQPAFGTHWTQPQLQSCQGIETGSRETRRQRRRRDAKGADETPNALSTESNLFEGVEFGGVWRTDKYFGVFLAVHLFV